MTDLLTDPAAGPAIDRAPQADTDAGDDRLRRNASALVISGVLTSVLGFAFWVVAARVLPREDVGTGAALVAAVVLLGNVSTLGLRNAFPRFLPVAGHTTARLVARGYALCAASATVLGVGFVLGSSVVAESGALFRESPLGSIGFVAATAGWSIFILQDGVLTGLRRATWVPVENLIYAVAKIALLAIVVSTGRWALLLAWAIPAVAVLAPLNVLIFRRLMPPRHPAAPAPLPFDRRSLIRFSAGEHAADVVKNFGAEGLVLVVLAIAGATQSAVLFFALTIAASLQLVTSNIVNAFVAEAAARPDAVDTLLRRSALHAGILVVPAALAGAALAPVGLAIFGADYAADGTTVLRLLLLALIPQIGISLAIGVARFERRVGVVFAIAVGTSIAPLAGALFLTRPFGIVAIGWSVLLGHGLLVVVLATTVFRQRLIGVVPTRIVDTAITVRDGIRHRRRVRAVGSILDELDAVHTTGAPLVPRRVIRNTTDVVVLVVDHPTVPRVIKIALSPSAAFGLRAHAQAFGTLREAAAAAGDPVARILPEMLETGTVVGHDYVIESKCRGIAPLVADHSTLAAIAQGIGELHRITGVRTTIGESLIVSLVDDPLSVLAADGRLDEHRQTLDALRDQLDRALRGRVVTAARTHGDTWLGNVLVEAGADHVTLTGVVDWEDSQAHGLPEVDLAHLWLSTQDDGLAAATLRARDVTTIGDLVGAWAGTMLNPTLPGGAVVLLAWLAHVAAGLERSSKFALGQRWLDENVRPVLEAVQRAGVDA